MKRRLRKKKHLGEFRQMGFYLYLYLREEIDESISRKFKDSLLEDFEKILDAPPVGVFWGESYFELFICPARGSATDEDREWLRKRLEMDINVQYYEFGPLIDAWYDRSFRSSAVELHQYGPWTGMIIPGKIWWKSGQPAGWMAAVRWIRQQRFLRLLEDYEEEDDNFSD
ncbi:MAG: 50S ribosome-binding protein YggL [Candidatus Krumholzibacteriales bacterium]